MALPTIKSSTEISLIFKTGKRKSNKYLTLLILENLNEHGQIGRVAFIAGKKNGNACWRNFAKRRMREIARAIGAPWSGYDILFIAKREITKAPYSKVLIATENLLKSLSLGM